MSAKLHCSFIGVPLHSSLNGRNVANYIYLERGQLGRRACHWYKCAKQDHWTTQVVRFSHFCGQSVKLFRRSLGSKYVMKVKCVEERFSRSKALVRSLSPLWKEGLLLIRCSVFTAVISGVCLLVWYGQTKAKGFIEAKILPSVCSALSEHIQRELDFGKVRRISPLSITLESCSIGPQNEEFSCGEVPTMKIRLHPFASLRRGKIVVDAVLSHPSMLVMQKKDFTWLGLPTSEGSLERHFSTEEGIDYRTKTRRITREETAAQWERERDIEAKKAAEMGYVVSNKGSSLSKGEIFREGNINFVELTNPDSFICMDEKMHWRDHHCMDTGVDYDMKHADLEKSFGVKIPGSGLKFWSRVIKGPRKHNFKRKAKESDISASSVTAKRRILERSALAAFKYFQGLSHGNSGESSRASGAYDERNLETFFVKSEIGTIGNTSLSHIGEENLRDGNQDRKLPECSGNQSLNVNGNVNSQFSSLTHMHDPAFNTLDRQSRNEKVNENFSSTTNVIEANAKNGEDELDVKNRHSDESQGDNTSQNSTPQKHEIWLSKYHPVLMWPLSVKSGLPSFSRNVGEQLYSLLCGSFQKLTSGMGPRVEDIVAELADGVDIVQAEGIEKMIPVILDSVHFKGGTLMLLGYGDREPR